jgi:hypothetical protein
MGLVNQELLLRNEYLVVRKDSCKNGHRRQLARAEQVMTARVSGL